MAGMIDRQTARGLAHGKFKPLITQSDCLNCVLLPLTGLLRRVQLPHPWCHSTAMTLASVQI